MASPHVCLRWFDLMWVTFFSWQINIDYRTREKTKQSLEDPTPTSLNEVQAKVYSLMEKDSYPRFLRSKMYQDMVNRASAQGQRRSVWPGVMKTTEDIKLDLHCKSSINPLTSLNTVNLQGWDDMLDCFLCIHQLHACNPTRKDVSWCTALYSREKEIRLRIS